MNTNLPVEYRLSLPSEWDDVVDFANFVFSQAHRPHDFKTLLPKVYADGAPEIARHFVAVRGGRIRAMVADCLQELRLGDRTLRAGMVGTVSVHPYSRGEGHMKKLMAMMIDDAQQSGLDLLILGGQRQRYGYFGFDNFGCTPHYTLTDASVRHGCAGVDASGISFSELTEEKPDEVDFAWALSQRQISAGVRPRAEFLMRMHSWNQSCRLIRREGEAVGYVMGDAAEIALTDEALLPAVLKALMADRSLKRLELDVMPYEKERTAQIAPIVEGCVLRGEEMVRVLNWERVLDALMRLRARSGRMLDGEAALEIDGERLTLRAENNRTAVERGGRSAELVLTGREAVRLLMGMEGALCADARLLNWLPLPLHISGADTF